MVPNILVIDNDFCIIYGHMMFYILQRCALIIDVILKRGRFLSTSVSRIIDSVSINFDAIMFQMLTDLSEIRVYIDQYNVYFGPIIFWKCSSQQATNIIGLHLPTASRNSQG